MRFLIDECVSPRVGEALTEAGHDAVHLRDVGLLGASDEDVMAAASGSARVVVSADTDFGELLAARGATLPSLILLRQSDRTAVHQARTILANLPHVQADLTSGAVVSLTDDRVRVRPLPIH
ncbi:DUF5615 family PIN-like protein [Conexibacter sp. S30A1]|uniref:DUF5615 family PIN-like protein n=1 Tax=Conexibacter sp. S30A1 TaxID=2937800 RepID=UPI00200CC40A|nr:DUF5615 family PIN-like protein [Conexibacter sp. S30A1]